MVHWCHQAAPAYVAFHHGSYHGLPAWLFITGDETELRPWFLDIAKNHQPGYFHRKPCMATSKFVQTNSALTVLNFSSAKAFKPESGEEVSTREVKKMLSDLIEGRKQEHRWWWTPHRTPAGKRLQYCPPYGCQVQGTIKYSRGKGWKVMITPGDYMQPNKTNCPKQSSTGSRLPAKLRLLAHFFFLCVSPGFYSAVCDVFPGVCTPSYTAGFDIRIKMQMMMIVALNAGFLSLFSVLLIRAGILYSPSCRIAPKKTGSFLTYHNWYFLFLDLACFRAAITVPSHLCVLLFGCC